MSISYRIDQELGTTFIVWDGTVVADEFLAHVQRLLDDVDWPPHRHLHLADLRTATVDASINGAVLEKASDLYGRHLNTTNLRVAVAATEAFKQAVIFERFFMRYPPSSLIVFNHLETACRYLDIHPHQAERALELLRTQSRRGLSQ